MKTLMNKSNKLSTLKFYNTNFRTKERWLDIENKKERKVSNKKSRPVIVKCVRYENRSNIFQ